jgi:hypothetical protein
MDDLTKYIETNIKYRLGILTEESDGKDESNESDKTSDDGDDGDDGEGDDIFSQEDLDAAAEGAGDGESETDNSGDNEDGGGDSGSMPNSNQQVVSDQEKIRQLFSDIGDPKVDYSLTSEPNVRLARFKFKYAGIDPITLMTDDEKKIGVRSDKLESRLTPDQYQLYLQKNKELRQEFPQIASRERKIIIYNSNVPMFYKDENGVNRNISHKKDMSNAIDKIEKFMNKSFGEDWVDNKKSINFLQNIKINFSEEKRIRPNLIPISYFQPDGKKGIIAFNKLYAPLPSSIDKFINDNIDSQENKKSPLFRTFINDYSEGGEGSSRISVYCVVNDPNFTEESAPTDDGGGGDDSGNEESSGGGDEGGDIGEDGMDDSMESGGGL